jgi:hypothetical protein
MKMEENSLARVQLRYLTRHFFGRFFDSEAIAAPHTDMHLLFVQVLALLVFPGLLKVYLSITSYSALAHGPIADRDHAALIDEYFFLCLSMILTGFITVFEWDALFPDQKDFQNLTPLPIEPRILFFAKLIALSLFVGLCNIAINGIPSCLFPASVLTYSPVRGAAGNSIQPGELSRYYLTHVISLFVSSVFAFTSIITIRAVFLLIVPARLVRIVSRCTQLALLLILLCALLSFPARLILEGNALIYLFPPFWFLGVYEALLDHHSVAINSLAHMAFTAVAISGFLSIISYTIGYRSSMQKGFQAAGLASYHVSGIRKIWTLILHRTCLKNSIERAYFHFAAKTVFRRQEQTLLWGSFVVVGIAFVCTGYYSIHSGHIFDSTQHLNVLLSFPLMMSFFILVGLRFTFSVPADLNANWMFKIMDKQILELAFGGVHKVMLFAIMIPLLIIFVPCYLMIWDPRVVCLYITYVTMLSLILIELLLFRFEKLPFACSYIPGRANIKLLWPAYVLACVIYSYETTVLERWMLEDIKRYVFFIFIAGGVCVGLHRYGVSYLKRISAIRFEEKQADAMDILSLG